MSGTFFLEKFLLYSIPGVPGASWQSVNPHISGHDDSHHLAAKFTSLFTIFSDILAYISRQAIVSPILRSAGWCAFQQIHLAANTLPGLNRDLQISVRSACLDSGLPIALTSPSKEGKNFQSWSGRSSASGFSLSLADQTCMEWA